MGDLVQVLQENPLFETFSPEELTELGKHCQEVTLTDCETLFQEGEKDDEALYFILEGTILIFKGQGAAGKVLAVFGVGNFFGDMSFLDSQPRSASAVADGHTTLYKLTPEDFAEFASAVPKAALKFFKVFIAKLVKRLRETDDALMAQTNNIITS
jgi:CRP-like cAMP-binding protein